MKVLLSAPPQEPIHPIRTSPHQNFRLQKINEISNTLDREVNHSRLVVKKYKRFKRVVNWSATGCGGRSTALSSTNLGSALSSVVLPTSIPLGGLSGAFVLGSSCLIVGGKKLDAKIKKHEEIVTRHNET